MSRTGVCGYGPVRPSPGSTTPTRAWLALARGITRHHADDTWFHSSAVFAELSWRFTAQLRDVLAPDEGMRPSFLGHILVEILLDAELIARHPDLLAKYYDAFDRIDPAVVQGAVNRMATRRAERLAGLIPLFARERFLSDYAEDATLLFRLNQVMRRVRLPALPERLQEFLPEARREVAARHEELLNPDTKSESGTSENPIRSQ